MDDKTKEAVETPEETPEEEVVPEPKVEGGEDKPVKDRTSEQFEKLKKNNKTLAEDRDKYKKLFEQYQEPINRAPSANQYQNLDQNQINSIFAGMVDADGYLDGNKLATILQQQDNRARLAEQRAIRAEQGVIEFNQTLRREKETKAQKAVYKKYPQLNPEGEEFDPKMWRAVYNELAVKAKSGTNPTEEDYENAADMVYNDFYKDTDMNKKKQDQLDTANTQKAQITSVRPRSSIQHGYYDGQEADELRQQVRQGKKGALAALLRLKEQGKS